MKDNNPKISLTRFCRLLGLTRQSYYQHFWQEELVSVKHELVLQRVLEIRENHRHIGTSVGFPFLVQVIIIQYNT